MAEANADTTTTLVSGDRFCIHVTNLSSNTFGEDLAKMFETNVEYVLLDTMKNEAWIKNIFRKDTAETRARNLNGKRIGDQIIKCQAMVALIHIAKLCSFFRNDACQFGVRCSKIHIWCKDRDKCAQKNCYYGHTRTRPAVHVDKIDNTDSTIERYRIKITGLPMGITEAELREKLGRRAVGDYVLPKNQTSTTTSLGTTAYLREQTSEKMVQKSIQFWRTRNIFPGFEVKYQLEIDHNNVGEEMFDFDLIDSLKTGEDENVTLSQRTNQSWINSQIDEERSDPDEEIGKHP